MQIKLAILTVLTTRPDGRATLDELKSEVEALAANEDQPEDLSSGLDDIDIFQSGLVIREDGGFRITDAGRSALKALKGPRKSALDLPPMPPSQSLKLTGDLAGTEERPKIFDLDPRRLELPAGKEKQEPMKVATLDDTVDDRVVELPEDQANSWRGGRRTCRSTSLGQDRANRRNRIDRPPASGFSSLLDSGASELRRRIRIEGRLIGWRASLLLRLPKRNPSLDCGEVTSCMTPQIQKRSEPPVVR